MQFYFFFGLALSVLVKGSKNFGMLPPCNKGVRVVLFRPFDFIPVGRIISIIFISILLVIYKVMMTIDYVFVVKVEKKGDVMTVKGNVRTRKLILGST